MLPSKRAESADFITIAKRFREAGVKAGLPEDLVLYWGRHDYGTGILNRTGNLAAVMRTMGHKDVKTAMQFQHPAVRTICEPPRRCAKRHHDSSANTWVHQACRCTARHPTEGLAHPTPQLHYFAEAEREQPPKVVQDVLRHASYGITMNVYDSAVSDEKREAHSGVMRLLATRTRTRTWPADGRMATA